MSAIRIALRSHRIFRAYPIDDLSGPEIRELLEEHLASMRRHSPPESVYALPIDELRKPGITFWTVWENEELLGGGALKGTRRAAWRNQIDAGCSATPEERVARTLLPHIIEEATRRGYRRLSLETDSMAVFEPARQLYARHRFSVCEPFGNHVKIRTASSWRRSFEFGCGNRNAQCRGERIDAADANYRDWKSPADKISADAKTFSASSAIFL